MLADNDQSYSCNANSCHEEEEYGDEVVDGDEDTGEQDMDEGLDDQEDLENQDEDEDGEFEEGESYFNSAEYELLPKASSTKATNSHTTSSSLSQTTTTKEPSKSTDEPVVILDPPSEDQPLARVDPALLSSQTSQEALEKALNAWYNAGYAAALYHIRSGMVKP